MIVASVPTTGGMITVAVPDIPPCVATTVLVKVPDVGHASNVSHPDPVNAAISDFLNTFN